MKFKIIKNVVRNPLHCELLSLHRGYGDTDQPVGSSEYSFNHLTEDIVKLIPALGHSSCVLVGHDWGGVVSW